MQKLTARALISVFTAAGFLIALPVQARPSVGTPPACGGGNKDGKKKQKKPTNPSVTARADAQCGGGNKDEKKKEKKPHNPSFSDAA